MSIQTGWRWCSRCQVLVYGGYGNGVCFDDEAHYLNDSGPYVLTYDETPEGTQDGWRWCGRCQALAYGGGGDGVCHDGAPHDLEGSAAYSVPFGSPPEGGQAGWRWCSRCQLLLFTGFGDGVCWDGRRHYPDDSLAYCVVFESALGHPPPPPPPPPPVPQPRIDVTERGGQIGVVGELFTPDGWVLLSFVRGGDVKKVDLRAGADGRISHVETVLDPEHVGGIVFGSDLTTQKFAVGRTVRSFPYIPRPVDL